MSDLVESMFEELDSDENNVRDTKIYESRSFYDINTFSKDNSLSPLSILIVKQIQKQVCNLSLRVLFDSGSDASHIQQRSLPKGIEITPYQRKIVGVT